MVAVKAHEAERVLAAPPEAMRLFLVYGSDQGAVTERARHLEQLALKRSGGEAPTRIGSDELSSDPGRIADEVHSASLFGGEPVVALRVTDGRHNVIGAVQPVLSEPPQSAWLIVEAGDLAASSPLRRAFERSRNAIAVPAFPLEGRSLQAFVHAAAEEAGVTIDPPAMHLLVESLGGDRLAGRGELEKLFLYVGDSEVATVEDVEAIVGDTTGARTDEAIDAALLGDSEGLESGLDRMRADGGSAVALATLALRHLILLQSLRASVDAGRSVSDVIASARPPIFFRRRAAVEAALSRWTSGALVRARRRMDQAILSTRLHPALEDAAVSEALHAIAQNARKLRNS